MRQKRNLNGKGNRAYKTKNKKSEELRLIFYRRLGRMLFKEFWKWSFKVRNFSPYKIIIVVWSDKGINIYASSNEKNISPRVVLRSRNLVESIEVEINFKEKWIPK